MFFWRSKSSLWAFVDIMLLTYRTIYWSSEGGESGLGCLINVRLHLNRNFESQYLILTAGRWRKYKAVLWLLYDWSVTILEKEIHRRHTLTNNHNLLKFAALFRHFLHPNQCFFPRVKLINSIRTVRIFAEIKHPQLWRALSLSFRLAAGIRLACSAPTRLS